MKLIEVYRNIYINPEYIVGVMPHVGIIGSFSKDNERIEQCIMVYTHDPKLNLLLKGTSDNFVRYIEYVCAWSQLNEEVTHLTFESYQKQTGSY